MGLSRSIFGALFFHLPGLQVFSLKVVGNQSDCHQKQFVVHSHEGRFHLSDAVLLNLIPKSLLWKHFFSSHFDRSERCVVDNIKLSFLKSHTQGRDLQK